MRMSSANAKYHRPVRLSADFRTLDSGCSKALPRGKEDENDQPEIDRACDAAARRLGIAFDRNGVPTLARLVPLPASVELPLMQPGRMVIIGQNDPPQSARVAGTRRVNGKCDVGGCGGKHKRRGMCHMHARRWEVCGRPDVQAFIAAGAPPAGEWKVCVCSICRRADGSPVGRFGANPDPMGGLVTVTECGCGKSVCGECRDECCAPAANETTNTKDRP